MGVEGKMRKIAETLALETIVLRSENCCGMAGDRGMLFPELTNSALSKEAAELNGIVADGYYASNLPCEAALSNETGKEFVSIIYLILEFAE